MRPSYLQNHYSLEKTDIGYRFLTTSNVEYYLTFIEYPDVDMTLATKMYVFNIEESPVHVSLLFASDHFNQQNLRLAFNHLVENNFYC